MPAQASSENASVFSTSGGIGVTSDSLITIAAIVGAIALLGLVVWIAFRKGK